MEKTTTVPYLSIFNNINLRPYFILAFQKDQNHSHTFF